jgi:hypothetical protein
MNALLKSLIVVVVLSGFTASAKPGEEVVITTRDGKSRQGRVLSETRKGYLFSGPKGTSVIAFGDIVDMKNVEAAQPTLPEPVKVEPVAQPLPVAPPPPPPSAPAKPSVEEVIATTRESEKAEREGFHFGIGANLGIRSGGPIAQGQVHFDFNFGRPAYRISVNFSSPAAEFFVAHIDNFFHWNFGDHFALGGGIEVGLAWGGGYNFVYLAPVIQPVIVKLGGRGQHQLSATVSVAVNYQFKGSYDGTIQAFAGYSYFF